MDQKQIEVYATRLYDALNDRISVGTLSDEINAPNVDDAYAIQMKNVEKSLAAGAVVSGKKIGRLIHRLKF
jgi:2-keto-4-pentenoate hydratase